jgi:transcriptional regulator with XRE-family HTH domain
MYNGEIIRDLLRQQGKRAKDLLAALEINTNGSLSQLIKKANPTADRLEKIADFLNVPIDALFVRELPHGGYNVVGNGNHVANITIGTLKGKLQDQQQIIEEKDKRIKLLEEMIELYRQRLSEQKS